MYSEEQIKNLDTEKELRRILSMKTEADLDRWIEDMGLADCIFPVSESCDTNQENKTNS